MSKENGVEKNFGLSVGSGYSLRFNQPAINAYFDFTMGKDDLAVFEDVVTTFPDVREAIDNFRDRLQAEAEGGWVRKLPELA